MSLPACISPSVIILVLLSIFSRLRPTHSFQRAYNVQRPPGIPNSIRSHSCELLKHGNPDASNFCRSFIIFSTKSDDVTVASEDIFGSEFTLPPKSPEQEKTYWRGNQQYTEISPEKRGKVMSGYNNLRITFLLDNLFISALGLCLLWSFGTYKDAFSYGVGALLGTGYAALLARYVESLGSKSGGGAGGGAARFAPVVLLILLYSKNKEYISIVPEILGFFTFQVSSLLQIFNEDAYGESE